MARSKRITKRKNKSPGTLESILRHKKILIVLSIFIFGSIGAYLTFRSEAFTPLSRAQCDIRGRVFIYEPRAKQPGQCLQKCQSGAGKYTTKRGFRDYCSNAVSRSTSKSTCKSKNRHYIADLGCARRWQQTRAAGVKQCISPAHTYYVTTTDFCADPKKWVWPVPSTKRMGSTPWGQTNSRGVHKGIDIGNYDASSRGAKVVASHVGRVTYSKLNGSSGHFIRIKAEGTPYWQSYQHLSSSGIKVKVGDWVAPGQEIGQIGNGGQDSSGNFYHLHYSVEKGDYTSYYASPLSQSINPLSVLPR